MKHLILLTVIFCVVLISPPILTAEVILEPQTSVPAATNLEPQTSVPAATNLEPQTGAPAATNIESQTNVPVNTNTAPMGNTPPGVTQYSMQGSATQPQEVTPGTQSPEEVERYVYDLEEYIQEVKIKLAGYDLWDNLFEKLSDEDGQMYNLQIMDRWSDALYELIDELGPKRSAMSLGFRPSGNYSKGVRFACSGDYQANGVYFVERDLNEHNGDEPVYWSNYEEGDQRELTDKVEAFLYHDFIINPRFEFANGAVTLHTQFKHGGYMWETAFPDYHYDSPYFWGAHGQKTDLDTTKLSMTGIFLEAITPIGMFLVGKLPEDPALGLSGIGWGCPLPPVFGFLGAFGLYYGKIMEGMIWDDDRKGWEGHGWDYIEVQNGDDDEDDDDLNVYAAVGFGTMSVPIIGGRGYGGIAHANIKGDDDSVIFSNMDMNVTALLGRYSLGTLRVNGIAATLYGSALDLSDNTFYGELFQDMRILFGSAKTLMGSAADGYSFFDVFETMPEKIDIDPVYLFAGNAYFDWKMFRPEACFIYAEGTDDPWKMPMIVPAFLFQSKGNRTPQGMLKSYLLNEVEQKYFTAINPPALTLVNDVLGFVDLFSTNITTVKAGCTFRLSKHFSLYGQSIWAWRTNVDYYKENYWDYFMLTNALDTWKWYYNDLGERRIKLTAMLQDTSENYHKEDIDKYLGLELSTKLTFHIINGLDLSLIGAYFQPGGFYEDVLTPKKYLAINGDASDVKGGDLQNVTSELVYGPYRASRYFDLCDSYTVQFKFDLKWDD